MKKNNNHKFYILLWQDWILLFNEQNIISYLYRQESTKNYSPIALQRILSSIIEILK